MQPEVLRHGIITRDWHQGCLYGFRMSAIDQLALRYPVAAAALPRAGLLTEPTPLRRHSLSIGNRVHSLYVKHDERSGALYGGNKVRKLDYLLGRMLERETEVVATFGAIGSHHALATALYCRHLGMTPVCFLGHQPSVEHVYATLAAHVANGTRIVRFGGPPEGRCRLVRSHLKGRRAGLIPAGGSSWLGTVGFIDAALEFAAQLEALGTRAPLRLYVANGTMGTTAGLALGFALAETDVEIHAVRVTSETYANRTATERLMRRTVRMLHRIDPSFPARLDEGARIRYRGEFVGEGYTRPTLASREAIAVAHDRLGLELENTYTAKAFAAILQDLTELGDARLAFWNTYNAQPLPTYRNARLEDTALPPDFARYFPSA